jgi:hypothetical protein
LPVVERRANEIQIGLDPRHAVVATDLPPILMDILRGLDGKRSTTTLLALARDEHADRLRAVLRGLTERGLVEDAEPRRGDRGGKTTVSDPTSPDLSSPCSLASYSIGVHGGGRLAAAVTTLLAASGVGQLSLAAEGVVSESDLGSGFRDDDVGCDRRTALGAIARRVNPEIRTARLRPSARAVDLVILTDAVVPAPEVLTELVAAGTPHLITRVREGIGIVGPLVVPGRSSCARCADLHRTGFDSCWPRIASQLAGRYHQADLTSVHGTAALTTGQVLATLTALSASTPDAAPPPTWNATLELNCVTGVVRRRQWPPHPRCSCGAKHHPAHL